MPRNSEPVNVEKSSGFPSISLIQSIRNDGMLETGDPLAGTERNEVSAKNNGILGLPFFHHSIIPLFH